MTPFLCHSVIQSDLDKHLMLDIKMLRNNCFPTGQIIFTGCRRAGDIWRQIIMGYLTLALAGHCLPGHGRTVTTRTETPEIGSHFLQPLFRCNMLVFH